MEGCVNMIKRSAIVVIVISLLMACYITAIASDGRELDPQLIGENAIPYSGSGTAADPNRYLIDETCKVTWKHVNEIKAADITEIYEKRNGDTTSGKLLYSWQFKPENLTDAYGPYFLGIYFYKGDIVSGLPGGDSAMYFSVSHKRHFPGVVILKLNVSGAFSDGERVSVTYYGGYDAEIVHGTSPIIDPNEIRDVDEEQMIVSGLVVSNGCVTFSIRHGGNYYLLSETPPEPPAASPSGTPAPPSSGILSDAREASGAADPADITAPLPGAEPIVAPSTPTAGIPDSLPGAADSPEPIYAGEEPLGTIIQLFPEAGIAAEIALQTGKTIGDTISQGDLDSIQSLYLDSLGLTDISSILRQSFAYCSSLSVADNDLKTGGTLRMPMLERLDISGNTFKSLNWLEGAASLKHLIAEDNGFTELPLMPELPSLQTLDLSNNGLTDINGLAQPELVYIDLTGNPIEAVPLVSGCPKLNGIDIDDPPAVEAETLNKAAAVTAVTTRTGVTPIEVKVSNIEAADVAEGPQTRYIIPIIIAGVAIIALAACIIPIMRKRRNG
jgi:Leucine-rich repeat (LRR) protein